MREENFHRPNEAAMQELLQDHTRDLIGAVLRLAWLEGLSRDEIFRLEWSQVDYERMFLHLPDRDIPLDRDTADCLRQFRAELGSRRVLVYVAVSEKTKERVAMQSLSRIARTALDSAGMEDVRLIDLRLDFIRRQIAEHDWQYAVRVSGISVTTYRTLFSGKQHGDHPTEPPAYEEKSRDERLWKIMQEHQTGAAGVALWLSQMAGLTEKELVALTWDQIDLDRAVLHTARGSVTMTQDLLKILRQERSLRAPSDDPHVILTPRTRRPMDNARLSTILRDLLVRGGIDGVSVGGFRHSLRIGTEQERIMQQVRAKGSITRLETEALLGVSTGIAYSRLADLVENGKLARTSRGYFLAEEAIRPEDQPAAVCRYIAQNGGAYCQDIAKLLRIGKSTASRLLRRMVANGDLVMTRQTKQYFLPSVTNAESLHSKASASVEHA